MASFDIQSLFTNFPLDERTDIYVDVVYNKCKNVKGMLKPHFKQLRTLSVKSSFFIFSGAYYKQIDGAAMGSTLRPKLANIFLTYYKDRWSPKYSIRVQGRVE